FVESAGLDPGILNKNVVEVMNEIGIDISNNITKSVFKLFKEGRKYDYVITVCEKSAAEACPIFPGEAVRFHWDFVDPSTFTGSQSEILDKTRNLRDQIKTRIEQFINVIGS
ncbi:MAG: arsenate reductase ArsC, partial [Deltaproteobacteria bacterium]|nr:arsenate reductase ArsC [Deltaproteobacteria bacterium]